ncbi:MAG: aspartate aminotransferase family protein [Clostridiales bacterium]|nr:aspartate aminotransferase family protein [Clostridiales bacterium]
MGFAKVTCTLPGQRSEALLKKWAQYEADKTGFQAPVAIHHGRGAMLYDEDGNAFLDWTSGVLVCNLGHCHPVLVKAVQEAGARMMNVYEYCTEYRVDAAEALVKHAPKHLDSCFILSTGSEATDAAVRIMKRYTGNFETISFYGGFHGRTLSTASIGGLKKIKKGMGPMIPGSLRAPFPYCYRCPFRARPESCGRMCLEFLDDMVQANSVGSLAGLIVEPYLGTAGFIFPPEGYMPALEKWCREHEIPFTLDEIQASYGRTGTLWACEHEGLTPDIVTLGKGLGSGITVSALLMRREVIDRALGKGELGSTYGGNPVSCAAISAVLEVMDAEDILGNVARVGRIYAERLPGLLALSERVGDVRGKGLVWGIEIVADRQSKEPAPELVRKLIVLCAQNGLLIGSVGFYGNVVRVAPPLVCTEAQAHESIDIMSKCVQML